MLVVEEGHSKQRHGECPWRRRDAGSGGVECFGNKGAGTPPLLGGGAYLRSKQSGRACPWSRQRREGAVATEALVTVTSSSRKVPSPVPPIKFFLVQKSGFLLLWISLSSSTYTRVPSSLSREFLPPPPTEVRRPLPPSELLFLFQESSSSSTSRRVPSSLPREFLYPPPREFVVLFL